MFEHSASLSQDMRTECPSKSKFVTSRCKDIFKEELQRETI